MDLIARLEALRIPEFDFFGVSSEVQQIYEGKNDRLDDCLEIVRKWLEENKEKII